MERVYNFSAGPAVMPEEVLAIAAREMLSYQGTGMSVMEMSHRSKMYLKVYDATEALVCEILHVPDNYRVLFLQGGATGQFSAVPMNLLTGSGSADYVDSGNFAHTAMVEARKYGTVRCVASSEAINYTRVPELHAADFDPSADYFHITTNNTIYGTRYVQLPDTGSVPLVADMSSNILSEVYDINKFGLIYAGAQKNLGPSGVTLVIVRDDLIGREMPSTPRVMSYGQQVKNGGMLNTPTTYGIYMAKLCLEWLKERGGVPAMEIINVRKANALYAAIDESALFTGCADAEYRSRMNVTFKTGDESLDKAFIAFCAERGLLNLAGHRAVGGMRASIYNAMPESGVDALIDAMRAFEKERT